MLANRALVVQLQSKLDLPWIVWSIARRSDFAEGGAVEVARVSDCHTPLPPKFGALKFGWLRMLKNSARNCMRKRSLIGNRLEEREVQPVEARSVGRRGPAAEARAAPGSGTQPVGVSGIGPSGPSTQGCLNAFGLLPEPGSTFRSESWCAGQGSGSARGPARRCSSCPRWFRSRAAQRRCG